MVPNVRLQGKGYTNSLACQPNTKTLRRHLRYALFLQLLTPLGSSTRWRGQVRMSFLTGHVRPARFGNCDAICWHLPSWHIKVIIRTADDVPVVLTIMSHYYGAFAVSFLRQLYAPKSNSRTLPDEDICIELSSPPELILATYLTIVG